MAAYIIYGNGHNLGHNGVAAEPPSENWRAPEGVDARSNYLVFIGQQPSAQFTFAIITIVNNVFVIYLFVFTVQKSQMIITHRYNYLSCYKNYPGKGN